MTLLEPKPSTAGSIGFVDRLAHFGERVAVIDEHGVHHSYDDLDRLVSAFASRLGGERRLAMIRVSNTLDSIVGYLGALRAGNVVLLTGENVAVDSLLATYDPDVIVSGSTRRAPAVDVIRRTSRHDLHDDLALLLSTSGSTGSCKLVRLSHHNVASNASAIASSLSLRSDDRAITTLPLHYCFGLSVLHSHLAVGASLALTSASVVDSCFWDVVASTRPTVLAAVPHTIELLDRVGFTDRDLPHLRTLLQAGGRLDPDDVRRYGAVGRLAGWDLHVMYGQTEATARMAHLPPAFTEDRPQAVGVAIDGGALEIEPFEGCRPGTGEIIYTGPNVMMGYAVRAVDLAGGNELDRLATGDVGRIAEDGLLEVVGRRSDFLKLFGLRIDLAHLRDAVRERFVDVHVDGDDVGVTAALLHGGPSDVAGVAAFITATLDLPPSAVAVAVVSDVPRLVNGKIDRTELRALVRSGAAPTDGRPRDIADLFAKYLGVEPVGSTDTFVALGGDSLTYVEVSIALEQLVQDLPSDWPRRSIAELESLAVPGRGPRSSRMETNVVLRAIAIVLIVGNHAGLFLVPGGAHVLFAAAGFNFARFQLGSSGRWRSVVRLAVPSVLWIGGAAILRDDFTLTHGLLLHGWLDGDGRWIYWFVEALVQILAVLGLVFSIPAVRRAEARAPFAFATGFLALTLVPRFDLVTLGSPHHASYRPQEIAWLFALGWAIARARTPTQRLALTILATVAIVGFFGDPTREMVVLGGVLLLTWVPHLPVPRSANRWIGAIAGASLFVYLSHVQVFPLFDEPAIAVVASLAFGVALWRAATPILTRGEAAISRRVTGSAPAPRR